MTTPPRPSLPECLTRGRAFVVLPRLSSLEDDGRVFAVLEVLAQEGLEVAAVHVDDVARLAEFADMFVERMAFGVHGVSDAEHLQAAIEAGAEFVLPVHADPALVSAGLAAGVAVLPAALTPHEVHQALALGAAAVQIVPADLMGGNYAEALFALLGKIPVVARGGLGGWSAGRWYSAGAVACGFDDGLLGDSLEVGGNMSQLRDRCRTYVAAAKEAPALEA